MDKIKVLIAGLNYNQLPYVKEIKRAGYVVVGIDKNPKAPAKKLCNVFYCCGYDNIDEIIKICQREGFTSKDLFFTASLQESYFYLSEMANLLGIKFPHPESVKTAIDKIRLYHFFKKINIPIPQTYYIYTYDELKNFYFKYKSETKIYYLKSDFSKNPNYVYRIKLDNFDIAKINWTKDRYLRKGYVLQEECKGVGVRINIFGNYFTAYDFLVDQIPNPVDKTIIEKAKKIGIFRTLKKISENLKLNSYLLKFDVIIDLQSEKFVVLDIGMDPPYRMRKHYESLGYNFAEMYVKHCLQGFENYPLKYSIN